MDAPATVGHLRPAVALLDVGRARSVSSTRRGYDARHQRARARALPNAIGQLCPRCANLCALIRRSTSATPSTAPATATPERIALSTQTAIAQLADGSLISNRATDGPASTGTTTSHRSIGERIGPGRSLGGDPLRHNDIDSRFTIFRPSRLLDVKVQQSPARGTRRADV